MILLETKKLGIKFGGLAAVWNVDIQVKIGEAIGLIGPNGSGKSTFFNLITGIYTPTEGKILFKDKNLCGLSPHKIAKNGISRTFQDSRLFSRLSVLDNVLVGMNLLQNTNIFDSIFRKGRVRGEMSYSINEALTLIEYFSTDLIERRYQKVKDLPQADKRRVEICRAIASKPKLLLLDEPSAGMNPEETSELMNDLTKVKEKEREMGIIVIEHDMKVIQKIADRVVVLNYGEKIFEGTFEEASHNKEVKEAYLGSGDKGA